MTYEHLIPSDKFDLEAVTRAGKAGYPIINAILPQLLEWVQDANWPVAKPVVDLLSKAGPEIVPHIRDVFNSEDGAWKYWILELIVPKLSADVFEELRADCERLAAHPTEDDRFEEVDISARDLLVGKSGAQ